MYFYILFLNSDTIYYVNVSKSEFESLLSDLKIEFKNIIFEKDNDNSNSHQVFYYYFYLDHNGNKKEIGYVSILKETYVDEWVKYENSNF